MSPSKALNLLLKSLRPGVSIYLKKLSINMSKNLIFFGPFLIIGDVRTVFF